MREKQIELIAKRMTEKISEKLKTDKQLIYSIVLEELKDYQSALNGDILK